MNTDVIGRIATSLLFIVILVPSSVAFIVGVDGWTSLEPNSLSLVYYVSSSAGNDTNSGLTPAAPLKTISAGMQRLRNGYPDHLLLKRGDVWYESFGYWTKSGRSLSEPMVVGSYGASTARPRIVANNTPAVRTQSRVDYLAFTGMHLQVTNRPAGGGPSGIFWLSPSYGLLFEDCLIEGFSTNIVIQGYFGPIEDVRVRRCVIVDAYDAASLSQGLYAENVDGLWLEECVADYNGWREGVYPQTIFNHNVYIHSECKNFVARGNIIGRASSHGIQARPGGTVQGNLFIRCPISLSFGYVVGGSDPTVGGISGSVRGNVMLEGNDIGDKPRGMGIQAANIDPARGAEISDNYFVRNASAMPYGSAIELQGGNGLGIHNTVIRDNICYGYNAGITVEGIAEKYTGLQILRNYFMPLDTYSFVAHHRFQLYSSRVEYTDNTYSSPRNSSSWFRANGVLYDFPGWKSLSRDSKGKAAAGAFPDPTRSIATYGAYAGFTPTAAGFLTEARKQSRQNWRTAYAAAGAIDHITAGFRGGSPEQDYYATIEAVAVHGGALPEAITTPGSEPQGCSVTLWPDRDVYDYGELVTCTAEAEAGHRFLYWEGDLLGEMANPAEIVATGSMSVRAVFVDEAEPLYSVDLEVVGAGQVSLLPPGNAYPYGTEVTLVAEADHGALGNHFVGYDGDVTSAEPVVTLTITDYAAVQATFQGAENLDAASGAALCFGIIATLLLARRRFRVGPRV